MHTDGFEYITPRAFISQKRFRCTQHTVVTYVDVGRMGSFDTVFLFNGTYPDCDGKLRALGKVDQTLRTWSFDLQA
jgi:hypothetical protein